MRVIVSGGGTGGHINPAIAIAKYILAKEPDSDILYIGTEYGMEKKLVPKENLPIKFIDVRGFYRKLTAQNIKIAYKAYRAIGESKRIIEEFKPDIVIGTGGYACGPVLSAAASMHIPTLVHEQNVCPGVTVKMLASKVDVVATSFDSTESYLKNRQQKIALTGNPVRPDLLETPYYVAKVALNMDNRPLVLMMGGSLGAKSMNDALLEMLERCDLSEFNLLCSTGERNYQSVMDKIKEKNIKVPENVVIKPYIFNTNTAFAAADLIVCRTGAITVSELGAAGKPSILVPSPNVAHNHQEYNARYLEEKGAAVMIKDADLTGRILYKNIKEILTDDERIKSMAENAKATGRHDATEKIYEICCRLIGRKVEKVKFSDIEIPEDITTKENE